MGIEDVLEAYRTYGEKEWENVVEGADIDLAPYDERIYRTALDADPEAPIRERACIEHHPEIARLRNRIESLKGYPRGDPSLLARVMRPDVHRLMALRTHRAQRLGYKDYPHFVFQSAGIDASRVKRILSRSLTQHLDKARKLTQKHRLDWPGWFSKLRKRPPYEVSADAEEIVKTTEKIFDLEGLDRSLTIHFHRSGIAGFARKFSNGSIHLVSLPLEDAFSLKTFLHELSHAVLYLANTPDDHENFLLPPTDEFLATFIENILVHEVCTRTQQDSIFEIQTLEHVRIILSALFEFDLWERVGTPEERYRFHQERLLPVENPYEWTLDTFRSVDSLLIPFYALGHCAYAAARHDRDTKKGKNEEIIRWLKEDILPDPAGVRIGGFFTPET